MEDFLSKLPAHLETASLVLSTIVVIATALVRLPWFAKHEEKVSPVVDIIQKVLSWLPTVGKNPLTKELEKKAKS